MLNTAKTLKSFFSGFGIPAYTVNNVPEDTPLPYITYPLVEPEWDRQASFYVQVWWSKRGLSALLETAGEIISQIGQGALFRQENGIIAIYPETPLMQILTDDDTDRAYINLMIRAYHLPGE